MIWISLLRGINVAGKNRVKMPELCLALKAAGFQNIKTYVQSGNIVLRYQNIAATEVSSTIKDIINENFGFEIPVLTFTPEYIKDIVDNCPFHNEQLNQTYVVFLSSGPGIPDRNIIDKYALQNEQYHYYNSCIYLYCPEGYGRTKLNNNFFEKRLKLDATTRNWRTVTKLIELSF